MPSPRSPGAAPYLTDGCKAKLDGVACRLPLRSRGSPMNNRNVAVGTILAAALSAGLSLGHAQERKDGAPFHVMETTIDDIHAAFKSGKLTTRQLVQGYLDRIAAYDKQGPNNSIITLNDRALEDADRLDAAYRASSLIGPLHGIPILVKDEIDTAGMPTTLGTQVFKDYRPPRDAFPIEKLRKAGAIILGKTTLSEYDAGDTYGSMFGIPSNPYDLERTAGGSSGGSGAALAANFSTVAIGEETFASIRRPAGWNGVASLRPTPGLVSRSGMWDGYPSPTAQMGPMAGSVKDLALLLGGMAGYDPEDPVTALGVGMADGSYTRFLDKDGLKGARIGILRESIGVQSEPGSEDYKKVDAARRISGTRPQPPLRRGCERGSAQCATSSVTARISGSLLRVKVQRPCHGQSRTNAHPLRHRYRFPLERRRVYRPAAGVCCLFEAISERQELLLAERGAEEGNADGKVVSGESCGHDQIRKTREIGDVRRRCGRACGSGVGRRGKQRGSASRCWIDDRVKLLGSEETLDGRPDEWQTVIAHGCVPVVLKGSARCFTLEQRPATWIGASVIRSGSGEAIGLVDHVLNCLGIFRSDRGEIVFDLCGKFRHANGVVELELRIEQPFRKPYIDDRRA